MTATRADVLSGRCPAGRAGAPETAGSGTATSARGHAAGSTLAFPTTRFRASSVACGGIPAAAALGSLHPSATAGRGAPGFRGQTVRPPRRSAHRPDTINASGFDGAVVLEPVGG